jgi:hypothetical protein
MANLKINRLEIRLKGLSPQAARTSVAALGRELLAQLAKQEGLLQQKGTINISNLDAGTLPISQQTSSADMGGQMASRIVKSVASETNLGKRSSKI